MFIVRTGSRWFELLGESLPRATRTPFASNSGIRACSGIPFPPFAAVTGHIATAVPVRARHSISASSSPSPWERRTFGPRIPIDSRYSVGRSRYRARDSCRASGPLR